jgi:hypothetical protein
MMNDGRAERTSETGPRDIGLPAPYDGNNGCGSSNRWTAARILSETAPM